MAALIQKQKENPGGKHQSVWDERWQQRRRTQVTNEQEVEERCKMPSAKFYPMKLYKKQFGDPRSKENKVRGHKPQTKQGVLGVQIPVDIESVPWDIETSTISRKTTNRHSVGHGQHPRGGDGRRHGRPGVR